jgi:hypothetical protein
MVKITFDLFSAVVIGVLSGWAYSMINLLSNNLLKKFDREYNFWCQLIISFLGIILFMILLYLFILINNNLL